MPFTTTKLAPMRGITIRPTALPSRGVALQLAGEEGDPRALVGQARERALARRRRRRRVRPSRSVPLRWSWRNFAYSAEIGSCQTQRDDRVDQRQGARERSAATARHPQRARRPRGRGARRLVGRRRVR